MVMSRRAFSLGVLGTVGAFGAVSVVKQRSWTFHREFYDLISRPAELLPYESERVTPIGSGEVFDADGVRIVNIDGTAYDQPVSQAQYVLRMLSSFRLTGDEAFLDAAIKNGERIYGNSIEDAGALYFPYRYDYMLFGRGHMTMKAPWYSGMAQGQVLSAFQRLGEATGEDVWHERAGATMASFLRVDDSTRPWSPNLDAGGHLWIEEYPFDPHQEVFNGHVFGTYGVYEYWLKNGDPRAVPVIDGAITTIRRRGREFRVPGEPSQYSALHPDIQPDRYHQIHIAQLLELYAMTGDVGFAALADDLYADYPPFTIDADVMVPAGRHDIRAFVSDKPHLVLGDPVANDFPDDTVLRVLQRRREKTSDTFWYLVHTEPYRGMWLRETDEVKVSGPMSGSLIDSGPISGTYAKYAHPRRIQLQPGTHEVFVDEVAQHKDVGEPVEGVCTGRQLIGGREFLHVHVSDEAEGWVAEGPGVVMDA